MQIKRAEEEENDFLACLTMKNKPNNKNVGYLTLLARKFNGSYLGSLKETGNGASWVLSYLFLTEENKIEFLDRGNFYLEMMEYVL
jgi:hypothetical protein